MGWLGMAGDGWGWLGMAGDGRGWAGMGGEPGISGMGGDRGWWGWSKSSGFGCVHGYQDFCMLKSQARNHATVVYNSMTALLLSHKIIASRPSVSGDQRSA